MRKRILCPALIILACGGPADNPASSVPCSQYDRARFGYPRDADKDCYDTRAEILIARSLRPVVFEAANKCIVAGGLWIDPYSGDSLTQADSVQIDHLVPLREAFVSGASAWPDSLKIRFANTDSLNQLVVTRGRTNDAKGDKDVAAWTPPGNDQKIWYARQWLNIKAAWGLKADADEIAALRKILGADYRPALAEDDGACK